MPIDPPRILFLNRSYWPDAEATGQLLTELCEDLAAGGQNSTAATSPIPHESSTRDDQQGTNSPEATDKNPAPTSDLRPPSPDLRPPTNHFSVTVVCGQPNSNPTGATYRRRGCQVRHGVSIHRVWHTRFAKSFLPGRIANYVSFLLSVLWAVFRMQRPSIIVVETDPPLLSLIGGLLQRWRKIPLVVYLQDIHPDIGVALGKLRDSWLTRLLRRRLFAVYRRADRVVVLSRDMRQRLLDGGVDQQRVVIVPNWVDTALIRPIKQRNAFRRNHGLDGRLLVMYSGNLGLCQRLEDVVAAAERLKMRTDLLFLLIGDGAMRSRLEQQVRDLALTNVRFLPYQPKARLSESLSAADLHLVPLDPRVADCLMPSKLYGILASGTPLLAIAPQECELADLVRQHRVGQVVAAGQPQVLATAIEEVVADPEEIDAMGRRARDLAEKRFDRHQVTARFAQLLKSVLEEHSSEHGGTVRR
jgi:colanic acid biosynthesis glycosyl transferase WcaI